ncbi:MAG: ROK family protein [Trueperaceae bacterium]|nr:ROK family protein [Trueperaceae bacterium]
MIALGLDLGGTKIAAATVRDGRVLARERQATPQTGFADVLDALVTAATPLLAAGDVDVVGIGCPGPLDFRAGRVRFAPNIAGMEDAPLVDALHERLGLPIVLENDANAAGYAEHRYGAARDLASSVFVTLSTGIGGGVFVGDEVLHGAHGLAGEIGHMVLLPGGPSGGDGHLGTWEALAAGRAIARDASYVFSRAVSTEEAFALARAGDRRALAIVDQAARFTGLGLANLVKAIDPEGFVLGGGMIAVGDFYLDRVRDALADALVGYAPVTVRIAELGGEAGVIGAAAVAAHAIERAS